jgi:hypothetical protein
MSTQYVGKAGQLAVMAELAVRGYNIAMPEIDIGDDIFAVKDDAGQMWRIQVKTSIGEKRQNGWSAQFSVRESAISTPMTPELHFVFVTRTGKRWRFVVISRAVLQNYVRADDLGSESMRKGVRWRTYYISFRDQTAKKPAAVVCSKKNFDHHLSDWTTWPELI